jgi:hypothetical protein
MVLPRNVGDEMNYSAPILAARITHFSVSAAMSLPKSAGVVGSGTLPRSAGRTALAAIARSGVPGCRGRRGQSPQ